MEARFFAFFLIFSKFAKVFAPRVWIRTEGGEDGHVDDGVFYAFAAWCLSPASSHGWASRPSFLVFCFLEQP